MKEAIRGGPTKNVQEVLKLNLEWMKEKEDGIGDTDINKTLEKDVMLTANNKH